VAWEAAAILPPAQRKQSGGCRPMSSWPDNGALAAASTTRLLAPALQILLGGLTGAGQIVHCLMPFVGHPHGRELAGARQLGQAERIPLVGLHPVAGILGISEGAATMYSWPPRLLISRQRPYLVGKPRSKTSHGSIYDRQAC
jgi:hypothetical protein